MSGINLSARNLSYLLLLAMWLVPHAQAATLITTSQSGNSVEWLVASTTFPVDKVVLTITGPDQSTTIAGCTDDPSFSCSLVFPGGTNPVFDTTSLAAGAYNWQAEIVPAVGDPAACDSPTVVRDNQGGNQGLSDGTAPTPEEEYLECIRNLGLLPAADQQLTESGSFTIATAGALALPPSTPPDPTQPDNVFPVASCIDVTTEGSVANCTASADVNNGSYDPDGTLASIVQNPPGPFSLGATNVVLTVTDDKGATNSCSAVVTVTDSVAPVIQCGGNNITPPDAPVTFTSTGSDTCSTPVVEVVSYDCYRFNKNGKRIDTTDSCVVSLSGGNVTIAETSGVSSFIDWTVQATDSSGNQASELCTIEVGHPGKGKGNN